MMKKFLPNMIIFINLSVPTVNRPTRLTTIGHIAAGGAGVEN